MNYFFRMVNLKEIRQKHGQTQEQVATALNIPLGTYRNWEQMKSNPTKNRAVALADYFRCSVDDFIRKPDLPKGAIHIKSAPSATLPVYGRIAAGAERDMCADYYEVEVLASLVEQRPNSYYLVVGGDSMNREIQEGHLALIDPDEEVHNGDTAAINVNGYDATLKVFHKTANSIILSPNSTNPEHKDLVIDETSPDAPNLRILGKKVGAMYPEK